MNKKLKLILSCFCLCLTLGIMSVAVWAATTTNYTLSNTISYKIEDVYVRVQTKLYKKSTAGMVSQEDLISQCEALEGKKHSEITGVTLVETYDEFKTYDGKVAVDPSTTGCDCDIAYDTSAQNPAFAYYVVMEIENYASDPIHAYLLNNTTADINSYTYFTSDLVELNGTTTTSVVIGFALKDTTIALSATDAPFDLIINEGEYNPEDFMTFVEIKDSSGVVTGYSIKAKDTSISGPIVIPSVYNNVPVTVINSGAFANCNDLTSIVVSENVKTISSGSFFNCVNVTQLTINGNVSDLNQASSAFSNVGASTTGAIVNFGKNVTRIPANIFHSPNVSNLPKIVEVNFLGDIQFIGTQAFYNCCYLSEITIPQNVSEIGVAAFGGCTSLSIINWLATEVKDLTIPNGVFHKVGQDEEGVVVNFGENVTKIPNYLFYGNGVVNDAPKIISVNFLGNKITSIGTGTFFNCSQLKNIVIPESVTSIGQVAFYNCSGLKTITINESTSTNWGYASSESATEWTTIDLTNPETNVTYFTGTYASMYWKKLS